MAERGAVLILQEPGVAGEGVDHAATGTEDGFFFVACAFFIDPNECYGCLAVVLKKDGDGCS